MRIQDGFFGKRIFPERKFTVDFEWIMKSVIRSRMYSVFQNDVSGDKKQKCVENKIFIIFEFRSNIILRKICPFLWK